MDSALPTKANIMECSCSSKVSAESSLDFGFAFNKAKFSDRTLQVKIMPDSTKSKPNNIKSLFDWALTLNRKHRSVVRSNGNSSSSDHPATWVKTVHVSTVILAAKSPFFYKLFSNGMSESNERHVTIQIQESEEAAFMDMLKFMYTNTLSNSTPLDVLIVADKYEVASCIQHCLQLLLKSPMTCESALICLELPSTILMYDRVRQPLTDVAKEFLVAQFHDIKSRDKMLNLSLAGIEIIMSTDDLQVDSEDAIYDFAMKWARRHYKKSAKRRNFLNTRLLRLICFPFISSAKVKELLKCTDINPTSIELIFDGLSPHGQMSLVSHVKERAYKLRHVKVIIFDSPDEECIVYLDLKREECTRLLPNGRFYSNNFLFGGITFYLMGEHTMDEQNSSVRSFGLYLGSRATGSVVECEFSTREKASRDFQVAIKKFEYTLTIGSVRGFDNLFGVPWDTFIGEDSPYFINGIVHLRAVIKFKKQETRGISNRF